jgi:hypothetical protein
MRITAKKLRQQFIYNSETGKILSCKTGREPTIKLHNGNVIYYVSGYGPMAGQRLAWLHCYGYSPNKHIVHINGIKTDNRICNLSCEVSISDVQSKLLEEARIETKIKKRSNTKIQLPEDRMYPTTPQQKKFNLRLGKFIGTGYKVHGNHLVRENGDDTKTYLLSYERYINNLIGQE